MLVQRFLRIILLGILLCLDASIAGQITEEEKPGADFQLFYRAVQPGEVVLLKADSAGSVASAYAVFCGKKYPMDKVQGSGRIIGLIGLDLEHKPGRYPLKVVVQYANGQTESTSIDVTVQAKQFPEEKLWVEEKFVTPPREVRDRIQWESDLLRSIYSVSSDSWLGRGSFILPVEGRASNNFGKRRIFNNKPRSPHSGQDISAPSGTPVVASNAGRVVLAKDLYFSGGTVIIDHGLGVFSYYCHFSQNAVKRGQWVKRGQKIGAVGATGRVTGPHLHWSVRAAGSRVDPYSLTFLDLE